MGGAFFNTLKTKIYAKMPIGHNACFCIELSSLYHTELEILRMSKCSQNSNCQFPVWTHFPSWSWDLWFGVFWFVWEHIVFRFFDIGHCDSWSYIKVKSTTKVKLSTIITCNARYVNFCSLTMNNLLLFISVGRSVHWLPVLQLLQCVLLLPDSQRDKEAPCSLHCRQCPGCTHYISCCGDSHSHGCFVSQATMITQSVVSSNHVEWSLSIKKLQGNTQCFL